MTNVKPTDLTGPQWLLLQHMAQYSAPFYSDFVYSEFSEHETNRLQFYRMFTRLAVLYHIKVESFGEMIPGQRQESMYILTRKGKSIVAEYAQLNDADDFTSPLPEVVKQAMPKPVPCQECEAHRLLAKPDQIGVRAYIGKM